MENITVITPLYKGAKYVNRIVSMVEAASDECKGIIPIEVELVLVNDYSQETIECPKSHTISIVLINNESNVGIHQSRINGLKESAGQLVVFFDQDDLMAPQYLISQLKFLQNEFVDVAVCNGWLNRFATIMSAERVESLDALSDYINKENIIISPGQCLIRKKAIPIEWIDNPMKINGADDLFLWILMLKNGRKFAYNEEKLYFHTPDRTADSVQDEQMLSSEREMYELISDNKLLDLNEIEMLKQHVFRDSYSGPAGRASILIEKIKMSYPLLGYDRIAIAGMGNVGQSLYEIIKQHNQTIQYFIDKSVVDFYGAIPSFHIDEELPDVDIIVVAVMKEAEEIKSSLLGKVNCEVRTIQELID